MARCALCKAQLSFCRRRSTDASPLGALLGSWSNFARVLALLGSRAKANPPLCSEMPHPSSPPSAHTPPTRRHRQPRSRPSSSSGSAVFRMRPTSPRPVAFFPSGTWSHVWGRGLGSWAGGLSRGRGHCIATNRGQWPSRMLRAAQLECGS